MENNRSALQAHHARLETLTAQLGQITGRIKIKKKTTSNLFRYDSRKNQQATSLSLENFNHILELDTQQHILNVEGLATYQDIVTYTLAQGFLPQIAPELKHITIGGAIVGIGIESSGFKYGFVHDSLVEAQVLLPSGKVVTARADNDYQDLFYGLANSYGTLGYILRAKIKLYPAKPYVRVDNTRFYNLDSYLDAMYAATQNSEVDFIEGLFYNDKEFYLTLTQFVDAPEEDVFNIYRNIYYKALRKDNCLYLKTIDYIFRYDPDWFWNVGEQGLHHLFRKYAPLKLRSSAFYNRYILWEKHIRKWLHLSDDATQERLIQDWEVPWEHGKAFLQYTLAHVDIQDRPWIALPIRPQSTQTLYPVKENSLYLNLGCYCNVTKPREDVDFYYTRLLDEACFAKQGIKMLYSSSYLTEEQFNHIYNGTAYQALKMKYDPNEHAPSLFEKAVQFQ